MDSLYKVIAFVIAALLILSCNNDYRLNAGSSVITEPDTYEKLDVLFVLDNSGSMWLDWGLVNYGLTQIPEELNDLDIDWKLAITSMDPADDAWIEVGKSNNPGWDVTISIESFREIAGANEFGFDGALRGKNQHPDFFRQDVVTLIIFVSDEHEQSEMEYDEFHNLWFDPHIVASIVGPEEILEGERSCAEESPKYHDASEVVIDICTVEPWSIISKVAEQL